LLYYEIIVPKSNRFIFNHLHIIYFKFTLSGRDISDQGKFSGVRKRYKIMFGPADLSYQQIIFINTISSVFDREKNRIELLTK